MKFGLSALVAVGVGLPFGGCTGVFAAAFVGGGLWTVALVTCFFIYTGYRLGNARWDQEQAKAAREQMELEVLQQQWEDLRTRKL